MKLSKIIKENRALVAGIILPLLLIAFFAVAKNMAVKNIAPPAYKVLFSTKSYSALGNITFYIDQNNHLKAEFTPNIKSKSSKYTSAQKPPKASLFVYDPTTNKINEILVKYPELDKTEELKPFEISIPEFDNTEFSDKQVSPDDYQFHSYYYRKHNLMTDIFIHSGKSRGPALTKESHVIQLPKTNGYNGSKEFIGWIIKE